MLRTGRSKIRRDIGNRNAARRVGKDYEQKYTIKSKPRPKPKGRHKVKYEVHEVHEVHESKKQEECCTIL
jgi:hypothetical protein